MKVIGVLLFFIMSFTAHAEDDVRLKEGLISTYQPSYFIFGPPTAKIQLSAKHQPLEKIPFFLGYTQIMMWRAGAESGPFEDVNYNPQAFFRLQQNNCQTCSYIDLGLFEHKSNGMDGVKSRTLNSSYIDFVCERPLNVGSLRTNFKIAPIYGIDALNPDIREYIGLWQIGANWKASFESVLQDLDLEFHFRPGGASGEHWDRGNQEFGIHFKFRDQIFTPHFFIQYFNGYGEYLLNYNHSSSALRLGVSL